MFNLPQIKWTVILLVVLTLVHGWTKNYEQDEATLEKWYLEKHPDVNNITWEEVEGLKPETHRKICDNVLRDLQPYWQQYDYLYEAYTDLEPESSRVKNPVLLELKREMLAVPMVECIYRNNASLTTALVPAKTYFYLTHADCKHVFTLKREKFSQVFQLQTGLHKVDYK